MGYPIKPLIHTRGGVDSFYPSAWPWPTHKDAGGKAEPRAGAEHPVLLF